MNETQDTVIEKASNRYDNVMIISMLTSGKRLGYYSSLQIRKLRLVTHHSSFGLCDLLRGKHLCLS